MKMFSARRRTLRGQPGSYRRHKAGRLGIGILAASLFLVGVSALHAAPPERVESVTVFGNDQCPGAADGEIVVCGHEPESERYRIPKALRETRNQSSGLSWASRVHMLDDVSRAGRPNSCSVVGSGGQTGCYARAMEQWFAERR